MLILNVSYNNHSPCCLPGNDYFLYLAQMKDKFFAALNAIAPLSKETMDYIDARLAAAHYPAQTILVRAGQLSDKMFFILNGALRAYYIHEDKEYTDWFMFENMFACSLSAFFGGVPSPQCIETLEATDALILTRNQLEDICKKYHDMSLLNSRVLSHSLVTLQAGFIDQRFKTAPERYALLLEHYPEVIRRVPLKYIATYLGVSQETLSRVRAKR